MKLITDGLIIGEQSVGEKDRLVTVLTRKSGVIRAFVKNCKSLKSAKGAATRLLCYSRLSIYCGRDTYIIDDAVCEEMFINLRNDIEDMSLSQYFCELSEHFAPKETDAEDFLRLILNALYFLNKKKRPAKLIKAVVEQDRRHFPGFSDHPGDHVYQAAFLFGCGPCHMACDRILYPCLQARICSGWEKDRGVAASFAGLIRQLQLKRVAALRNESQCGNSFFDLLFPVS